MNVLNSFETDILVWLNGAAAGPVFDVAARALAWLGENGRVFIALALVLLCVKRTRIYGAILVTALMLDLLAVNIVLKPIVARVRPYDFSDLLQIIVAPMSDYSFPSGHTAVAFAAAGALSAAGKKAHVAALVFATMMGLSRLYLMVHYPSDVLAGAIIGSLCGWLAVAIWMRVNKKTPEEE